MERSIRLSVAINEWKSCQSYECSPIGLGTALSSRAPYTRAAIVMYVNHTFFERALVFFISLFDISNSFGVGRKTLDTLIKFSPQALLFVF